MSHLLDKGRKWASFDNWDGFGGVEVRPETFANAERIIQEYDLENKPELDISYHPNGTISFEWMCVHGEINIEVGMRRYSMFIADFSVNPPRMVMTADRHF